MVDPGIGLEDYPERERAVQELINIGEPALETLRREMDNSDWEIRSRVQVCIREIELDLKAARCSRGAEDPRSDERVKAAQKLRLLNLDLSARKKLPTL